MTAEDRKKGDERNLSNAIKTITALNQEASAASPLLAGIKDRATKRFAARWFKDPDRVILQVDLGVGTITVEDLRAGMRL